MPLTQLRNLGIVSAAGITTTKLGTGAVLQVVGATDANERNTTSTSYVTASNTLSVSITPSSASNKIFVTVSSCGFNSSAAGIKSNYTIFRGATNIGASDNGMLCILGSASQVTASVGLAILDSPNTTSSTTYQVYFKTDNASGTASLNKQNVFGTITAFEIAG
jgi:hypothetical protein